MRIKSCGIALMLALIALNLVAPTAVAVPVTTGLSYYVDAERGSDEAAGTSPTRPWRTLEKVNATTFSPGDRILLRSGRTWTGQLWPKGSGAPGRPIVVDRYGPGAKPAVHGRGQVAEAVRLFNQQHWEIRNLEISNANPLTGGPGTNLRDLRGIEVSGDQGGRLDHFRISGVDVHDVTGEVNWIGGDPAGNAPGVTFKTGWDRSKNTGGIVFRGTVADPAAPGAATVLNDIVIENSTVKRTSFAGITIKQHTGSTPGSVPTGWGERANASDVRFTPHTNVVIRNNFIQQDGSDYACNGMYLTDVRGALVEGNVVYRAGTSGIEAYYADDVVIQHNEVYETQQKAGGADSNAIDPDKATTRIVVQYNFVHHNGDGILICQFSFGDVVIRYNTIASNTRYQIYLHSDRAANAQIYNNTIYSDRSDHLVYGYGSSLQARYELRNNIFYSTRAGASLTTSPTIAYSNNLYAGAELAIPDTHPLRGDPLFAGAISGPYGTETTGPQLDRALALRPGSGSAAVGTGLAIEGNGGRDYAGTTLYRGLPDVGAFEYRTPVQQPWESVNGFVRNQFGHPVEGVSVVLTMRGRTYQATTQADGFYRISQVPFGSGVVAAAKSGYDSAGSTVQIRYGDTTRRDLTVVLRNTDGSLAGQVLNERAAPLVGATVSVLRDGQIVATAESGADGGFRVPGLPMGPGYAVVARLEGREPVERTGLVVPPAGVGSAGAFLLAGPREVLQAHEFDDQPVGALPNGAGGWTVNALGNAVEVVEVPSAADRSVRIARSANTGGTAGTGIAQVFAAPLRGLVTIEARVMRDQPYVSGSNWFGLPYLYNEAGVAGISLAFDKGNIIASEGGSSRTVATYELGRWYDVRLVVDTVNQRYDLFIDGAQVGDDQQFRTAMPAVAGIAFYANSSNYGSAQIDRIRLAYGR
ncbi:carboxypeptidase regulatory-like domain-containing protein [Kribbella deserti]|uniref:Carboxypeptidase regulatory-like domain-containing protein n=1 Tax=Kribbella deserti TaxID=1926257 RepID=A0ABV6QHG4_9ACTN